MLFSTDFYARGPGTLRTTVHADVDADGVILVPRPAPYSFGQKCKRFFTFKQSESLWAVHDRIVHKMLCSSQAVQAEIEAELKREITTKLVDEKFLMLTRRLEILNEKLMKSENLGAFGKVALAIINFFRGCIGYTPIVVRRSELDTQLTLYFRERGIIYEWIKQMGQDQFLAPNTPECDHKYLLDI